MTIFIVIPVHNRAETTLRCLACINNQTYRDLQVVVVDDGSTDGTAERIKAVYPETEIVRGDGNLWWTGSMRLGVEHALRRAQPGDYIMSLNDDVQFERDYLSNIIESSLANGRAVTGSLCLNIDIGTYWVDGGRADWKIWTNGYSIPQVTEGNIPPVIDNLHFVFGHGTVFPVEVFEKIGNFNAKDLPHYGGDGEFSYRAGKAGFRLIISTKAIVKVDETEKSTGIHRSDNGYISFRRFYENLTSIRSRDQLSMNYRLLDLCCPRKYRLANKIRITLRNIYSNLIKTLPFFIPKLILKYWIEPYPVPAFEVEEYKAEIGRLVQKGILRKIYFAGEDYYGLINRQDLAFIDNDRLRDLFESASMLRKKIYWFCRGFKR